MCYDNSILIVGTKLSLARVNCTYPFARCLMLCRKYSLNNTSPLDLFLILWVYTVCTTHIIICFLSLYRLPNPNMVCISLVCWPAGRPYSMSRQALYTLWSQIALSCLWTISGKARLSLPCAFFNPQTQRYLFFLSETRNGYFVGRPYFMEED